VTKPEILEGEVHLYILQKSLFSFDQWLEIDSTERLELFFSALDLHPYAVLLKSSSPQGAKPIDREAILRSLLVAPLEGISTFTRLHNRLRTDLRFRYQFGFRLDESAPSVATLSRVFAAITEKGIAKMIFIFKRKLNRQSPTCRWYWKSNDACVFQCNRAAGFCTRHDKNT
jgi:hypothetical protein